MHFYCSIFGGVLQLIYCFFHEDIELSQMRAVLLGEMWYSTPVQLMGVHDLPKAQRLRKQNSSSSSYEHTNHFHTNQFISNQFFSTLENAQGLGKLWSVALNFANSIHDVSF
jgi:hypothetical protein